MNHKPFCLILIIIFSVSLSGCSDNAETATGPAIAQNEDAASGELSKRVERVEVYHFHRERRCPTCIMLGDLAEETVKSSFSEELKSGMLTFGHINIDLPENIDIVERYGPSGSSLWIGRYYSDGSFEKEEDTAVWYKIGNELEFKEYLEGLLKDRMV